MGGFSSSTYLTNFLGDHLTGCTIKIPETLYENNMKCIESPTDAIDSDTSISSGGLLRFLNQADGPAEIMRTSYGFTQQEVYNEELYEAHRDENVKPFRDDVDEKDYVRDCLRYFVKKVREVLYRNRTRLIGFGDRATSFLLEARQSRLKSPSSVPSCRWMRIFIFALKSMPMIPTKCWKTTIH